MIVPPRLISLVVAILLAASFAARADTTSPGKNAVFVSETAVTGSLELLGSIVRVKRGQILRLDVFFTVSGGDCGAATEACIHLVRVNNEPVQPTQFGGCAPCTAFACTVSGSFWFDPEAEDQLGGPLDILVVLEDGGVQCNRNMSGSMSAELVRR